MSGLRGSSVGWLAIGRSIGLSAALVAWLAAAAAVAVVVVVVVVMVVMVMVVMVMVVVLSFLQT